MTGSLSRESIEKKNLILDEMHSKFQDISDRERIQPFSNRWSKFYTNMRKAENISFLTSEFISFEKDFENLTQNIIVEEIGHMRMGLQELRKLI